MAFNTFLISVCIYCTAIIMSVLDTATAITMRPTIRKILYWVEKISGVAALVGGIIYMTM